jgi:tetratricopeptide (TPR) repeat protein
MCMVAKRLLENINIFRVTFFLFGLLCCLEGVFYSELSWARRELPNYLKGTVSAPLETQLIIGAANILQREEDFQAALPLLERAVQIDPNSEAVFWLGEYYFRKKEPNKALHYYCRYLDIDPLCSEAYLRMAQINHMQGEDEKARSLLTVGIERLSDYHAAGLYKDPTVPENCSKKAETLYSKCTTSLNRLQAELEKLSNH